MYVQIDVTAGPSQPVRPNVATDVHERSFQPVQDVLNNLLGLDGARPDWNSDKPLASWLKLGDSKEQTTECFNEHSRKIAQAVRDSMQSLAPTHICAVCSCFVSQEELHCWTKTWKPLLSIPATATPHTNMATPYIAWNPTLSQTTKLAFALNATNISDTSTSRHAR